MTLEEILELAIQKNSTDIHFFPHSDGIAIQLRVAGQLSHKLTEKLNNSIINRIKILSDLDLSETRRSQEGQFNYQFNKQNYSIRTSIVNSTKGEKIALRLLPDNNILKLDQLNLPSKIYSELTSSISNKHGIVIVCGATGAGKTTTLYSCLHHLYNGSQTVYTIEDPAEISIDGFIQCEPNKALNIKPNDLLKSFLRQDPDIILVGEIRDAEMANLAITAALTGHLVFTTLHSNSALDVIHRLKNWEVDLFAFTSSIKLILHQKMHYTEESRQPIFSSITPAWNDLPNSYSELLQKNSLWKYYDNV